MPTQYIVRRETVDPATPAPPNAAPIYVDSDDNILKMIPAGSGTTEVQVVDASSAQTLTNKTLTAPILGAASATSLALTALTNQMVLGTTPNLLTVSSPAPSGAVTLTLPVTADTLVGKATTDVLTNKTLTSPVLTTPAIGAATGTSLQVTSFIKSSGAAASGGVGYSTGAGGAVTQITNRSTGVTMVPNPCLSGTITTDTTSLAAEASAAFIVTDSAVAIGDVVVCSIQSGSNSGGTSVMASTVTNGTFTLRVTNNNAAAGTAETGAILINFAIIKAVSA